jgi:PadR family transcriptional regulator PadR
MDAMDPNKLSPLRKGLLEFLILDIVSTGEVYVADILERLGTTDFATREGTLYPLLSKMRREGLLDYDWRESTSGPPRKYYRLTKEGRANLAEFRAYWASLTTLIDELGR